MKIRRAKPEEWTEIKRLNQMLFDYEKENFDPTLDTSWPDRNEDYYKNVIVRDNYFPLVCEVDGRIVGYIAASFYERKSYRYKSIKVEIENTFIEEEYRNNGVGLKMFKMVEDWAKEQNATELSVEGSSGNILALNFYHKFGFKDYNFILEKTI